MAEIRHLSFLWKILVSIGRLCKYIHVIIITNAGKNQGQDYRQGRGKRENPGLAEKKNKGGSSTVLKITKSIDNFHAASLGLRSGKIFR